MPAQLLRSVSLKKKHYDCSHSYKVFLAFVYCGDSLEEPAPGTIVCRHFEGCSNTLRYCIFTSEYIQLSTSRLGIATIRISTLDHDRASLKLQVKLKRRQMLECFIELFGLIIYIANAIADAIRTSRFIYINIFPYAISEYHRGGLIWRRFFRGKRSRHNVLVLKIGRCHVPGCIYRSTSVQWTLFIHTNFANWRTKEWQIDRTSLSTEQTTKDAEDATAELQLQPSTIYLKSLLVNYILYICLSRWTTHDVLWFIPYLVSSKQTKFAYVALEQQTCYSSRAAACLCDSWAIPCRGMMMIMWRRLSQRD